MTSAAASATPMPSAPTAPRRGARPRVVFLDAVRCLAIVLMVFAHVSDQLLATAAAGTEWFHWYSKTRGITAPLFFGVAGWAFTVATVPNADAFRRWGPPLWRRLRRVALLFAWGYLLTLPWWADQFPWRTPPGVWRPFWTFGVLQCIATALLVSHLLLALCARTRTFFVLTAVAAAGTLVAAPALQAWTAPWPDVLRGPFNGDGVGGGFPIAPHAAHFWLGNALGTLWWLRGWSVRRLAAFLAAFGAAMWGTGMALRSSSLSALGPERFWASSPSVFLTRAGAATLVIAAFAALLARVDRLPPLFARNAKHALTFYVAHMLVLWGVPGIPGLAHLFANALDAAGVVGVTFACLALTAFGCWAAPLLARASARIRERRRPHRRGPGEELLEPG